MMDQVAKKARQALWSERSIRSVEADTDWRNEKTCSTDSTNDNRSMRLRQMLFISDIRKGYTGQTLWLLRSLKAQGEIQSKESICLAWLTSKEHHTQVTHNFSAIHDPLLVLWHTDILAIQNIKLPKCLGNCCSPTAQAICQDSAALPNILVSLIPSCQYHVHQTSPTLCIPHICNTHTHTYTHNVVFTHTNKQTNKQASKQTNKPQSNKERKKEKERNKETNKRTKKQRSKQTNKQTNKETNKQTNKETHTHRHTRLANAENWGSERDCLF